MLEDGRIAFDGLSGTSAGAMNAVVLAQGWMDGGRDGARAALRRFWTALADTMPLDVTHHDADGGVHLAPMVKLWMAWAHYVTPAQFNPLDVNPLRDAARRPGRLRAPAPRMRRSACSSPRRTPIRGGCALFDARELSVDAVLASGCLPTVFHAPRIDGQTYWDGGYAGNPAVFPLLRGGRSLDTLLVLLSPLEWRADAADRHARARCTRASPRSRSPRPSGARCRPSCASARNARARARGTAGCRARGAATRPSRAST